MATIINSEDMQEQQSNEGWAVKTIADASSIGFPAMEAKWWTFEAKAVGPEYTHGKADEMLYVIRGTGQAIVDEQIFELDDESVLWLDEGESYHFVAGENGLEILQAYPLGENDG